MSTNENRIIVLYDKSWSYFSLHANQRMTVFNFYIIFCGLILNACVTSLEKTDEFIPIILSLSLPWLSFVFWQLDRRTRFLILQSEEVLKKIETIIKDDRELKALPIDIFNREDYFFSLKKQEKNILYPSNLSYSESFKKIYVTISLLGFGVFFYIIYTLIVK